MTNMSEIQQLRLLWTEHCSKILPTLARDRHPAQPTWPVYLDHCFARIILDNTVGEGRAQWDMRLKRPAVKNMSHKQLQDAIALAKRIENGKEDLLALDFQSLEIRGKAAVKSMKSPSVFGVHDKVVLSTESVDGSAPAKRKPFAQRVRGELLPSSKKTKASALQSTLNFGSRSSVNENLPFPSVVENEEIDFSSTLKKIEGNRSLTPYRKRLYAALLSVPRGRYTTYGALSDFLESSARAIGNGMRNNPFAPEVPCHRVLASDGSIGGFGGSWGVDGRNANKKFDLLREEGVIFDSSGRVRGPIFRDFVNLLADK